MITIKKSETADTRTCDWSQVTKEQLRNSSLQHIDDVREAMNCFEELLSAAAFDHDHDKLEDLDGFHVDFSTGFKVQDWYARHKKLNRHHIDKPDGVPEDVNLIDVLEHVADCVMAGMARSGNVFPIKLPDELLQRALANTVDLLKAQVVVEPSNMK